MILCALAAVLLPGAALADEAPNLLADSVNIPVIAGSSVPEDCHYPNSLRDAARYETACVVMARSDGELAARYIGYLGQHGWHAGPLITSGFSAVHDEQNGCEKLLGVFPSDYPPETHDSAQVVLWFALEREPRCATQPTPQ
jgi:hypothetical protein